MHSVVMVGAIVALSGIARADLVEADRHDVRLESWANVPRVDTDFAGVTLESEGQFVPGLVQADAAVFGSYGASYTSARSDLVIRNLTDENAEFELYGGASTSVAITVDGDGADGQSSGSVDISFELTEPTTVFFRGVVDVSALGDAESTVSISLDEIFSETYGSDADDGRQRFVESGTLSPGTYSLQIDFEARADADGHDYLSGSGLADYEMWLSFDAVQPAPGSLGLIGLACVAASRRRRHQ